MRATPPRVDVHLESDLPGLYGVSRRQAHRLARILGVRLGRIRLIPHAKLLEFLEAHAGQVETIERPGAKEESDGK